MGVGEMVQGETFPLKKNIQANGRLAFWAKIIAQARGAAALDHKRGAFVEGAARRLFRGRPQGPHHLQHGARRAEQGDEAVVPAAAGDREHGAHDAAQLAAHHAARANMRRNQARRKVNNTQREVTMQKGRLQ